VAPRSPPCARHICHEVAREHAVATSHPHQLRHTPSTLLGQITCDALLQAETLGHRGLGSVGSTKVSDRQELSGQGAKTPWRLHC